MPDYSQARQCKDIPDAVVVELVLACNEGRCEGDETWGWHGGGHGYGHDPTRPRTGHWMNRWDLGKALGGPPERLLLAKLDKMIRRGRLHGCSCGCRGDLTVGGYGSISGPRVQVEVFAPPY